MGQAHLLSRVQGVRRLTMRSRGPGRALTPEEFDRLFQVAACDPAWETVANLAMLAANTGLRPAELRRLCLGDVSLIDRMIQVQRTGTKTDAGVRLLPLNSEALNAAAWLLTRANQLGSIEPTHYLLPANGSKHTNLGDPSFGNCGFDVTHYQASWRSAWRRLTKQAGLEGFRFYDLRHHFVTRLAESGVPIQVTMSFVGHMSVEMTRYYTHISDRSVRDAVDAICRPLAVKEIDAESVEPYQPLLFNEVKKHAQCELPFDLGRSVRGLTKNNSWNLKGYWRAGNREA